MPRNVEIKARVDDIEDLTKTVFKLTDSLGATLVQEDTFFNAQNGRLKLRVVDNSTQGELIYYERPDVQGPKMSLYQKCHVENADTLKDTLGKALGVKAVIRKVRQLYIYEQTRIHVDQVDGLGAFMELEVCLRDEQSLNDGQSIANEIMRTLNIPESALESGAYVDLLTCAAHEKQLCPAIKEHNGTSHEC